MTPGTVYDPAIEMRQRFLFLLAAQGLFLASAQPTINILGVESPPFLCTEVAPCAPSIPFGDGLDGCINGGIKSANGFCVHGYIVDLIRSISQPTAANFSFRLWHTSSLIIGGYGKMVRGIFEPETMPPRMCGNWTCDMAVGDITLSWQRRRINQSKFSAPVMTAGLQILGRVGQKASFNFNLTFLNPFDKYLWLALFFTLFYIAFAIIFLEIPGFRSMLMTCCKKEVIDKHSWQEQLIGRDLPIVEALWFVFQSVYSTQDNSIIKTKLSRSMTWLWMLLVLILVASYTASLAADMTSSGIILALDKLQTGSAASMSLAEAALASPTKLVSSKGGNTEAYLSGVLHVNSTLVRDQRTIGGSNNTFENILTLLSDPTILAWVSDQTSINYIMGVLMDSGDLSIGGRRSGGGVRKGGGGGGSGGGGSAAKGGAGGGASLDLCAWQLVGEPFAVQSFAFPYGPQMDPSVRNNIDTFLVQAQNDLSMSSLKDQWFRADPACLSSAAAPSNGFTLSDFAVNFLFVWVVSTGAMFYRILQDMYMDFNIRPERYSRRVRGFFDLPVVKRFVPWFFAWTTSGSPDGERDYTTHGLVKEIMDLTVDMRDRLRTLENYHKKPLGDATQAKSASSGDRQDSFLPSGWLMKYDSSTGQFYYINTDENKVQWKRPLRLVSAAQRIIAVNRISQSARSLGSARALLEQENLEGSVLRGSEDRVEDETTLLAERERLAVVRAQAGQDELSQDQGNNEGMQVGEKRGDGLVPVKPVKPSSSSRRAWPVFRSEPGVRAEPVELELSSTPRERGGEPATACSEGLLGAASLLDVSQEASPWSVQSQKPGGVSSQCRQPDVSQEAPPRSVNSLLSLAGVSGPAMAGSCGEEARPPLCPPCLSLDPNGGESPQRSLNLPSPFPSDRPQLPPNDGDTWSPAPMRRP